MLLSDRDITAQLAEGRIGLDPYDSSLVQPSSIDVRLDKYFRLFDNHKYPHIDPQRTSPSSPVSSRPTRTRRSCCTRGSSSSVRRSRS